MSRNSPWGRAIVAALPAYVALVLAVLVGGRLSASFDTAQNLGNLGLQSAPLALAALSETLVVVTGGIDLSIGSVISLATAIMAVWSVQKPWLAVPAVLVMGLAVGALNGVGSTYFRVPSLIMTLGTGTLLSGVALAVLASPGGAVTPALTKAMYAVAGAISLPLGVVVAVTALLAWLTVATRWGLRLYASGARPAQSAAAGVATERVTLEAYTLAGFVAALSGLAMAGTLGSGDPNAGNLITLNAIAAVVLGGTALTGGRGGILGTLGGALLLSVVANLLNQTNVNPTMQLVVEGVVILLAVVLQNLRGRSTVRQGAVS